MSGPDLELRALDRVPPAEIVALLRLCMGEGVRRSESFWQWKHLDSPFGKSLGVAAYAGETLVGIRVFMRWAWSSRDRLFRAVRAVDTATHPEWRRQGLFRRLTEAVVGVVEADGIDFIFNTPNAQSRDGYLKMGWRAVAKLSVHARPSSPLSWVRSRRVRARKDGGPLSSGSPIVALLEHPRLEVFLRHLAQDEHRLHTPRTAQFLHWRYEASAVLGYRALWNLDASGRGAVVIARSRDRHGFRELLLSEVLVSDDVSGMAAARSLLRHLAALGEHDYAVAHASSGTPERRALWGSGFIVVPRAGPYMTVRSLGGRALSLDPGSLSSWRLGLGDLEVF